MDEIILSDSMKQESKIYLVPMILCFVLAISWPIVAIVRDFSYKELIIGTVGFVLFACVSLYGFLYAIKYRVTITKDKIQLKTLFKTVILNISDVKEFHYKRYMKSAFYQFRIFYFDKKVLINTRYHEEFAKILKEATEGGGNN